MSENDSSIETSLRTFIAENLLFSADGFPHQNDTSFLGEGIVDSIGVMELVTFVGSQFKIDVAPDEITPENFDSVNKLAAFIRRKQTETAPSA